MDRLPMRKRNPSTGITGGCYYLYLGNDFKDAASNRHIPPVGICLDTHARYCTYSEPVCHSLDEIDDDEAAFDKLYGDAVFPMTKGIRRGLNCWEVMKMLPDACCGQMSVSKKVSSYLHVQLLAYKQRIAEMARGGLKLFLIAIIQHALELADAYENEFEVVKLVGILRKGVELPELPKEALIGDGAGLERWTGAFTAEENTAIAAALGRAARGFSPEGEKTWFPSAAGSEE